MRTRTLIRETWVPQQPEEVFEYFSRAENLEDLTPPELKFKILTPTPIPMSEGTLIEYRITLGAFLMNWRTLISAWEPPVRFVDEQLRGPYLLWRHEHTFHAKQGGTMIRDQVDYRVPGWFLEPIIHALFVGKSLQRIFDFRSEIIKRQFGETKS